MNARTNTDNGINQSTGISSAPVSAIPALQVVSSENKVVRMEEFVKMTGANEALIQAAANSPKMPRLTPGIAISIVGAASALICLVAEYGSIPIARTPTTLAVETAIVCTCIVLRTLCCLILPIYWTFSIVKINRFLNSTGKGSKASSAIAGVRAFLMANGVALMTCFLLVSALLVSVVAGSFERYVDHQIQLGHNPQLVTLIQSVTSLAIIMGGLLAVSALQVFTSCSVFKKIATRIDSKMSAASLRQVKLIGVGCGALFVINSMYAAFGFLPGTDHAEFMLGLIISGNLAMLASFVGLRHICRGVKV